MNFSRDMLHEDLRPHYHKALTIEWIPRLKLFSRVFDSLSKALLRGKEIKGVECEEVMIPSSDDNWEIRTLIFRPKGNREKLHALLNIHGGGYIAGNHEQARWHDCGLYQAPPLRSNRTGPAYRLQRFPPTMTLVGTLDPSYEETTNYVAALQQKNVHVAFAQYENCFHGFELLAPSAPISKEAVAFTYETFADFYDRYALP